MHMGELPRADLLGHVKEIGEKAGEGNKNVETESLKLGDVGREQGIKQASPGKTIIIAEGLGPLPCKLIQRIQNSRVSKCCCRTLDLSRE